LTPFAQQALANEVRSRGLNAEVEGEGPSAPSPFKALESNAPPFFEHEATKTKFHDSGGDDLPDTDSSDDHDSYEEDRRLVDLCIVWSVRDALQVQRILDVAGIPFFMGPEKATGVDTVTSNFANGVGVQIMRIGLPWAGPAMRRYEPKDDPTAKVNQELDETTVRCPKCHSAEVVFEGRASPLIVATDDSSQKFKWTCDSCGHQWEDDGVAKDE
jgi:DNA-directed RNA polymerase subunit M/transcription elongation factor TFIIS